MSRLSDCPSSRGDLRKQVGQRETHLSHLSDSALKHPGVFQPMGVRTLSARVGGEPRDWRHSWQAVMHVRQFLKQVASN